MTHWTEDDEDELRYLLEDLGLAVDPSGFWADADENVGVLVVGGNVVIGWIEICWRGPVPPPDRIMRDPVHMVLPIAPEELEKAIGAAVTAARSRRQRCRYCAKSYPPGHMHESDVCHGCASEHLGVLY